MATKTFGYEGTTDSNYSGTDDFIGTIHTCPTDYFSWVSLEARWTGSTNNWKGVVTSSTGTILTNGVGQAATFGAVAGEWVVLPYATPPTLTGGTQYYLGLVMDGISRVMNMLTTGGVSTTDNANSYATPTNPTGVGGGTRQFQIRLRYLTGHASNTTKTQTNTNTTSLTANGNINTIGAGNATVRGFVYDTVSITLPGDVAPGSSGYSSSVSESGSFSTGDFALSVTGLTPATVYYVRAFTQNSAGYEYAPDEVVYTTSLNSAWLTA